MTSLLLSRRDLEFMLYEWLRAESLISLDAFSGFDRQSFDATLDVCEQLAKDFFAPHNKKNDQYEPQFDGETVTINPEVKAALQAFIDSGLMSATAPAEMGGMQLPSLLFTAGLGYFFAANIGTSAYPTLSIGNANTVLAHGTSAQIAAFAKPVYEGRFFGTMCLSEPQAGSSLSDITTRAEFDGESPLGPRYRLTGRKMWISAGEHELSENIVHLVLAKVPDESGKLIPGVKGISLFIVPKFLVDEQGQAGERNDVVLAGLNHKMGQRGVTNCLLNFGEGTRYRPQGKSGAVGYLVGNLHCGLLYMFHMMNEARIGVGLAAASLGYTGYLHALEYARNRPQGRPIQLDGKESTKPSVAIIEHSDVKRMLLSQKSYVEGALGLTLYCAKLIDIEKCSNRDSERERAHMLLDLLTPVAKSWPSQWCLEANSLAIQVHGGYGYTRDYNVEQFYRDNRLNPIHEGTHGIQAQDLLGRKVLTKQGEALRLFGNEVEMVCNKAFEFPALQEYAHVLRHAMERIAGVTTTLWMDRNPQKALANATYYLEAFGHVVVGWIWLQQACAAVDKTDEFYLGKLAVCRYFFEVELPKIEPQLDFLQSRNELFLTVQDAWF